MEILVNVERRVLLDMQSEIAGMGLCAEFEGMVPDQFMIDLNLDDGLFFLVHAKYN
jgi:hypothetical protein